MDKNCIYGINVLRFLSFIVIFMLHQGYMSFANLSYLFVTVFFVISGFVLNHKYKEKGLPSTLKDCFLFAINRIKKIYPLHLILMLFTILLFSYDIIRDAGYPTWLQRMPMPIIANLFLVQSWTVDIDIIYGINAVSWFLSTILFLYFCFPIIKRFIKNADVKKSVLIIVVTLIVQSVVYIILNRLSINAYQFSYFHPLYRLGDFICGYCTYNIYQKNNNIKKRLSITMELSVILLIVLCFCFYLDLMNYSPSFTKVFTVALACYIVFVFSNNNGLISKYLTNKYIVKLSDLSSYAWLIHGYFVQLVNYVDLMFNLGLSSSFKIIFNFLSVLLLAFIYDKRIASTNKKSIKQEHIYELDFLRLICMFGVFLFHFSAENNLNLKFLYTYKNGGYGALCTSCFFIISGFVLCNKYYDNLKLKEYFKSRILSIFPLYWLTWAFCSLRNLSQNQNWFSSFPLQNYLFTIFGLDGYFSQCFNTYYLVGEWFTGALIICYLLLPFLFKLSKNKKNDLILLVVLLTINFLQKANYLPCLVSNFPSICNCLLNVYMGVLLCKNRYAISNKLIFIFSAFVFALFLFVKIPYYAYLLYFVHSISFFIVFYNIAYYINKFAYLKNLNYIFSKYSYGFFLLHHIVLCRFLNDLRPNGIKSSVFMIAITFATTFVISIILTNIVKYIRYVIAKMQTFLTNLKELQKL